MKAFRYLEPRTLDAALALLADAKAGPTQVIAGGQDLLPVMKEHLAEPARVVNLKSIAGLDALAIEADALSIGALVTLTRLAEDRDVRARWTALAEAAHSVASPQIRTVATVGGNLCQRPRCPYFRMEEARCLKKGGRECFSVEGFNKYNAILGGGPSYIVHPSDLAPALVALDATVELRSARGTRALPIGAFFVLPAAGDPTRENVLAPDEVLVRVRVPAPSAGARSTYVKFKERESFDFALAAAAVSVVVTAGRVTSARVVLGGVAPIPWRSEAAERALVGRALDADSARACAEAALEGARPLDGNGYKVPLAKAIVEDALAALGKA